MKSRRTEPGPPAESIAGAPPMRLRLEAAPGSTLEQALNQACARGPSDEQMRALERAVLGALGSAGAASVVAAAMRAGRSTSMAAPSTARLSIAMTKVGVGLALAALTAGGVWAWRRPAATVATPASTSMALTVEPVEPPAPALRAPLIAGPAPRPAIAPSRPRHASTSASAATIKEPARTPAHPAADAAPVAKPAGAPADDGEELRLLSRAHSALAIDPAFALTLVHEHRRRFPSGSMDQEREVIAVSALMALGRVDEARQAADRFARDHAGSAYVARIHAIVTPATSH